jgi:alpha-L-fucosidase
MGAAVPPAACSKGVPAYDSLSPEDQERMGWWIDARYGMFIHWGVASIPGTELSWSRKGSRPLDGAKNPAGVVEDPVYDNLYKQFNPSKFNAKEWVRIAKAAGMKYMVLTAKHHDGFCLWDSKLTDYTIMNTPFKRDVVKEFTEACHEAGMKVGLYYSQRDWHHPDYGIGDNAKYRAYMNGQLTELLTRYGAIDIIWFDSYGVGDLKSFWGIDETLNLLKKLAPKILVNNRLAILNWYNQLGKPYWGDFDTPEQSIGKMQTTRPWESCLCFVGHQWGFKPNGEMYTLDKLIKAIVSCATGDGNLLMNVGPMPTGEIEPRQAQRLKEAGDWMAKYGESLYGTRGGPYENSAWCGSSRRGNTVYIHVLDWKKSDTLRLLPLPQKVISSKVLTGGAVTVKQTPAGLDLTVPVADHDAIDTIIELTLDRPSIELIKGISTRSIFEDGRYGGLISAKASVAAPITLDLGREHNVKGIGIEPKKERRFPGLTVSVSSDGTDWKDVWKGSEAGPVLEFPVTAFVAGAQVPGVKARYVKVVSASNKPVPLNRVAVYGE